MFVFGVIQSECGKMRTRITPNTDTFYTVLITTKKVKIVDYDADNSKKKKLKIFDSNANNSQCPFFGLVILFIIKNIFEPSKHL